MTRYLPWIVYPSIAGAAFGGHRWIPYLAFALGFHLAWWLNGGIDYDCQTWWSRCEERIQRAGRLGR